jgi:hypothetical protein
MKYSAFCIHVSLKLVAATQRIFEMLLFKLSIAMSARGDLVLKLFISLPNENSKTRYPGLGKALITIGHHTPDWREIFSLQLCKTTTKVKSVAIIHADFYRAH